VLVTGAVGATLAKREGLRVLRDYQRTLAEGRLPPEGLLGAVLVLAGGVLLVAPGLITDVVGLLLLVPPTRRLVVRWLRRRLDRALKSGSVRVSTFGFGVGGQRPVPPEHREGEGTPPHFKPRERDISDAEVVEDRRDQDS